MLDNLLAATIIFSIPLACALLALMALRAFSGKLPGYTLLNNQLEPILWLLAAMPLGLEFLGLSIIYGSGYYLAVWFAAALLIVLCFIILAEVFELLRLPFYPKSGRIPDALGGDLERAVADVSQATGYNIKARTLRVVLSDTTLGAHVRGAISPKVVISGGLMIGILQGDDRAKAILGHEIGHIRNLDRLIPGAIAVYLMGLPFALHELGLFGGYKISLDAALRIAIVLYLNGAIIVHIVRRREYSADYFGALAVGSGAKYASIFSEFPKIAERGTPFHPYVRERKFAIERGFPVNGISWFWLFYWIIYAVSGMLMIDMERLGESVSQDDIDGQAIGRVALAIVGCISQIAKIPMRQAAAALLEQK